MSVEIAEAFFSTLFFPCPVNGRLRLEVRTLENSAGRILPKSQWFPLTDFGYKHAAGYCMKMREFADVYMGVLPRVGETRDSEGVPLAPWLYLDIDGGEEGPSGAIELFKRSPIVEFKPNIAVVSGGGVHCYWRLDPYLTFGSHEERRMFKGFLKRLVITVGGTSPGAHADDSCTGLAQILRVPGTWNRKLDHLRPVKIIRNAVREQVYYLEAWDSLLHPLPNPRPISTVVDWQYSGTVPEGIKRWASMPFPEGKRHKDLTSAAAWLVRDLHIPKHEVEELLMTKAQCSPGVRQITEDEIRSLVKWA